MAGSESNDVQQMRQDAIRRSQEMYRRAQAPPGYTGSAFSEPQPSAPPPPPQQESAEPESEPPESNSAAPTADQNPPSFFRRCFRTVNATWCWAFCFCSWKKRILTRR